MTSRVRAAALTAMLLLAAFWLPACDSAPGVYAPEGIAPRVSNLAYSPANVVFEELPPENVIGDSVAVIHVELSVDVFDENDDVESVLFVINTPFDPFVQLHAGTLEPIGSGRYRTQSNVAIKRGNEGRYTILVYAVDAEGNLSNQARGILDYSIGTGRAPVIEAIEGPDSIRPPITLILIAVVSDPDGIENIARVVVMTPDGNTYEMFDNGETQGDDVANDGRYTARFDVDAADPGTYTFRFQAFDRSGLASEIVSKDITVQAL